VQAILAGQTEGSLDSASQLADKICEVTNQSTTASISHATHDNTAELLRHIKELTCQMASLRTSHTRSHSQSRDRRRNTPDNYSTSSNLCWYHWKFGDHARRCTSPCSHQPKNSRKQRDFHQREDSHQQDTRQQENSKQQTLKAANVCTYSSGRLFITDRITKQQYLIDTGSDLCVFPCKLLPGCKECTDYDLYAANGTTIHTYGWTTQSLDLGLHRDFTWHFVIADVQRPIIGIDLFSHYGLLIDCRHNRLLNGVTSLSTPGSIAPTSVPSVNVIAGGTPPDSLLAEFPELIKPTGRH
jgi:hypothetical protein